MRTVVVVAEGNTEHLYRYTASDNMHITPSSFQYTIVSVGYIGQTLPPSQCSLLEPQLRLSNGNKDIEITVKYNCFPVEACPHFEILFQWEETPDEQNA